jgi:molecular chaperone DnaJ
MVEADYYELLGVERNADGATIKSAYRRLAMQYHPDKNGGCTDAEAKFKAINEAYDCLKDDQKRAAYDRYGKAAFQNGGPGNGGGGAGFGDFADIFEGIFGEFMGGGRQRQRSSAMRGADLRYDLKLSLEEAFAGNSRTIEIDVATACEPCNGTGAAPGATANTCGTCGGHGKVRVQQGMFLMERTCPNCHGAGRVISDPCKECHGAGRVDKHKSLDVRIPAGVDDGTRIRLSGEGEAGARGGPPGDLYIFVHLEPHDIFERDGTNLYVKVPVPMTLAALGGTIEVPSIDREAVELKIPAGTQSGKQFSRRGQGMPPLNGGGRGDLIVEVDVETPTRLSKRQRELLEEFQALEPEAASCPESHGFFAKIRAKWDELTE